MKPPFAYYGAKTSVAQRVVALLPEHEHYIEPFAGSLAVLLAKAPSRLETVNDIDEKLMTFWRVLRERPADLARVCEATPHSRSEHALARDLSVDEDDLELARRVWILLAQGRSGTLAPRGWRYQIDPASNNISVRSYMDSFTRRILPAAERLRNVTLECRPAMQLIDMYGRCTENLLYIDPPYLGETRAKNYRHEMTEVDDHGALLAALAGCHAAVVLSGYRSDLYDRALTGWDSVELSSATGQGNGYERRTEVVWCNRPLHTGRLDFGGVA